MMRYDGCCSACGAYESAEWVGRTFLCDACNICADCGATDEQMVWHDESDNAIVCKPCAHQRDLRGMGWALPHAVAQWAGYTS